MGAAVAVLGYAVSKVKAAVTALVPAEAFAAVGSGIRSLSGNGRRVISKLGYQMGMVGALIFTIQLFDFPVLHGTTGHLIGAVLAVVLLGPFAGTITIAAVLVIQALFLADGGILAMGANIINMACFGGLACYYLYAVLKKYIPEWLSIGITAWLSMIIIGTVVTLELGSLNINFAVYAITGIAEALFTIAVVNLFRALRAAKG